MAFLKRIGATMAASLFILSAEAAVKVGEPAPDFSLNGDDGKPHALHDFKGKPVVLEWTNDGCPFVRKQYGSGRMQSLQKTYTSRDVVWLSMVSSAPGKQGFIDATKAKSLTAARQAAPTHVLLDPTGQVGHLYEAKTTPHLFVIDAEGKLVYAGGIDSIASADADDIPQATPYVQNALDDVLAGRAVRTPVTQPYGCAIKYAD